MKKRAITAFVLCCLVAYGAAYPQKNDVYSQHGKVVESHADAQARWIFKIEAGDTVFVVRGGSQPAFQLNDELNFRVRKSAIYVQNGQKEKKCRVLQTYKTD